MRTQLLFSVFIGIAVSGCGNSEHSRVPENTVNTESPDELSLHDVPYHLVQTMPDGSHVVQYYVEVMVDEMRTRTVESGQQETYVVKVLRTEEQMATVPNGEDISEFLSWHADGRIVNREPDVRFDEYVDAAPAPPAE